MRRTMTALLVITLLALTGSTSAAAGVTLRVATLNLCGSVCLHGEAPGTSRALAAQIRSQRLDVMIVNELCAGQYEAVRHRLGRGWSATFTTTTGHRPCRRGGKETGDRFGNAIFVHGTLTATKVTRLPWGRAPVGSRGREARSLLCTAATVRERRVQVCATHLSPDRTDRADQFAAVQTQIRPRAAAGRLVLAGDLNATARSSALAEVQAYLRSTNPAHLPTSTGDHPKEIDWMLSNAPAAAPARTMIDSAGSDHRWLIAAITV